MVSYPRVVPYPLFPMSKRRWRAGRSWCRGLAVLVVLLAGWCAPPASAQDRVPLYYVNETTTVRGVSFDFVDSQTFEASRLRNQIATDAPRTLNRLKRFIDWLPWIAPAATFPLEPVTLQKDVVRLRQFYQQNGFLHPDIDYPQSRLDTTSNTIQVVFSIEEGPPLIIQDASFYAPDSTQYAISLFESPRREEWIAFRDRINFRLGERYSEFNRIRIEDEVRQWLQNQGFAFARVGTVANIDSTANTADIRFIVDPGPATTVAEIDVEGNTSVSQRVVLRELPFAEGDRFEQQALTDGQRQLFGLNLFRVALIDVPEQPRDSSVRIRVRVRESNLRYLTAQTGYGTNAGLTSEGQWTHRNFLGAGRNLTVGLLAETGIGANPRFLSSLASRTEPNRRYRAFVSLRQPYLLNTRLSGIIEPFIEYRRNTQLEPNDPFLGIPYFDINARDFGLNTRLVYEFLPFRTMALQHTFTRSTFFTQSRDSVQTEPSGDLFNKSIFSLNGTFGRLDDFLNPREGFRIRPTAELSGAVFGSDVDYVKVSTELTGYLPLTPSIDLSGRLFFGRVWPLNESRVALARGDTTFENRFDDIVYYAGGGADLRGWRNQLVGEKTPRRIETNGNVAYFFEAEGGTAKLGGNLEMRLPFPGLSSDWRTAVFLDAGQVRDGSFMPTNMRFGTGGGIRYNTPVGFVRLDLAFKLNPGRYDLLTAREAFQGATDGSFWDRFALHFGIGQSF